MSTAVHLCILGNHGVGLQKAPAIPTKRYRNGSYGTPGAFKVTAFRISRSHFGVFTVTRNSLIAKNVIFSHCNSL